MKRVSDLTVALMVLFFIWPILLVFCFFIWWQDYHSPFYMAERTGRNGRPFTMIKLRSMIANADKTGVDSTANDDNRITKVGAWVRRFKLDELMQFVNVVRGDMSLVGPRPNVKRETDLYTSEEKQLLSVRPGITDFASIVFSDEGDILEGQKKPDLAYNQLIRPGKGYLGLLYIDNQTLFLDFQIMLSTVLVIWDKPKGLRSVARILGKIGAHEDLITLSLREKPLVPMPPPGASEIVTSRI